MIANVNLIAAQHLRDAIVVADGAAAVEGGGSDIGELRRVRQENTTRVSGEAAVTNSGAASDNFADAPIFESAGAGPGEQLFAIHERDLETKHVDRLEPSRPGSSARALDGLGSSVVRQ